MILDPWNVLLKDMAMEKGVEAGDFCTHVVWDHVWFVCFDEKVM
jgi:hypothetical protein